MCPLHNNILETLAARRARYSQPGLLQLDTAPAIRQTLAALDHPYSHYAGLTSDQREQVRQDWTTLAAELGVSLAQPKVATKKVRKAPPVPSMVASFFGEAASCLPHRPLAADDYTLGIYPCSWLAAACLRTVQLNPSSMTHWLIFDCDHVAADRWRTAGLCEPTFITINPSNGHHHVVYKLTTPVCMTERGRAGPQRYLRAVREALRAALDGDPGYSGLLTKNPLSACWEVIRPVGEIRAYTLAELSAGLDLRAAGRRAAPGGDAAEGLAEVGAGGRNRALFDCLRRWAYSRAASADAVHARASQFNLRLAEPLSGREVSAVAKSVARFVSRHITPNGGTSEQFKLKQAARGRLGGRPQTTGGSKPWVQAGCSRATWYRRLAKSETKPE